MKITIEEGDNKASVESNEVAIEGVVEMLKQVLMGYGFHPDTVNSVFDPQQPECDCDYKNWQIESLKEQVADLQAIIESMSKLNEDFSINGVD